GLFVVIGRVELVDPVLCDHDMAGGTGAGAAAEPAGLEAVLANDFHHPPALRSLQFVRSAIQIGHADHAHQGLVKAVVLSIELAIRPENRLSSKKSSKPSCFVRYSEHMF